MKSSFTPQRFSSPFSPYDRKVHDTNSLREKSKKRHLAFSRIHFLEKQYQYQNILKCILTCTLCTGSSPNKTPQPCWLKRLSIQHHWSRQSMPVLSPSLSDRHDQDVVVIVQVDGRACHLCGAKDNSEDPVWVALSKSAQALAVGQSVLFRLWGAKPKTIRKECFATRAWSVDIVCGPGKPGTNTGSRVGEKKIAG